MIRRLPRPNPNPNPTYLFYVVAAAAAYEHDLLPEIRVSHLVKLSFRRIHLLVLADLRQTGAC